MERVRTVIWDCDNVMWFHKSDEIKIIAEDLGIKEVEVLSIQFENMINAYNKEFADQIVTLKETMTIVEREMPILYFYGISAKEFMLNWSRLKFKINDLNEDILVVLDYLKSKGIECIIKTDWWHGTQVSMLRRFGILDYIETIHTCDNSYLKCNPLSASEIITTGREDEYVMIGDSLESDICFANNAGIKSIWFNRDGKKLNKTQYNPTYEITTLKEILQIL